MDAPVKCDTLKSFEQHAQELRAKASRPSFKKPSPIAGRPSLMIAPQGTVDILLAGAVMY
jgi:hypothetical protein